MKKVAVISLVLVAALIYHLKTDYDYAMNLCLENHSYQHCAYNLK